MTPLPLLPLPGPATPLPPTRTDTPLAGMLNELLAGQLAAGDAILDWLEDFRVLPRRAAQYQRLEEVLGTLVAQLQTIEAVSLTFPDWQRRARVTMAWERLREDVVAIFAFDLWGRGEILGWAAGVMGEGVGR